MAEQEAAIRLGGLPTPMHHPGEELGQGAPRVVSPIPATTSAEPPRVHADVTGVPGTGTMSELVRMILSAGLLTVFAALICAGLISLWWFGRADAKAEADRNFNFHVEIFKQIRDDGKLMRDEIREMTRATQEGNQTLQKVSDSLSRQLDELKKLAKDPK